MKRFLLLALVLGGLAWGQVAQLPATVATPSQPAKRAFDGAMTALVSSGSSTSPLTPSYTTNAANELALNIYAYLGNATFTLPGGCASVITLTPTVGDYSLFACSQTVVSSGGTAGNLTATLGASSAWVSVTNSFIPNGSTSVHASAVHQQASGNTNAVTLGGAPPTGDLVLGCIASTASVSGTLTPVAPPTGGTGFAIYKTTINGTAELYCFLKIAGGSEGTTYTFTQATGITTASTAFIIDIQNASYPDELLTSASASFTSAVIGDDLCVGYPGVLSASTFLFTTAPSNQGCGTISLQPSSTTVLGWGIWNTGSQSSGFDYIYGSDNTAALSAAATALTNGQTLFLPCSAMMAFGTGQSTTQIAFTSQYPVTIRGSCPGALPWFNTGNTGGSTPLGSVIIVANTSLAAAPILINPSGAPALQIPNSSFRLEDFALWGGIGRASDGGGPNVGTNVAGIQFGNPVNVLIDNVTVANFSGSGFVFKPSVFIGQLTAINLRSFWNGQAGVYLSANGVNGMQNVLLSNADLEMNRTYGLDIGAGGILGGLVLTTPNISRNISGEITLDSGATVSACSMTGAYFEQDTASNLPLVNNGSALANCNATQIKLVLGGAGTFTSNPFGTATLATAYLAADATTNTTTTIANTGLSFTLAASGIYRLTCDIFYTGGTGGTDGIALGLAGPGSPVSYSISVGGQNGGSASTALIGTLGGQTSWASGTSPVATLAAVNNSNQKVVELKGTVQNGTTGGTLNIVYADISGGGTGVTAKANSSCELKSIP